MFGIEEEIDSLKNICNKVLAILDCEEITERRRDGSHGGIWEEDDQRNRVTEVNHPNPPCVK